MAVEDVGLIGLDDVVVAGRMLSCGLFPGIGLLCSERKEA